jgi:hypothetical protein
MRHAMKRILVCFLFCIAVPAAFAQLWNLSEYFKDRINTEQTYFILHDAGTAEFGWASEWTNDTVMNNEHKSAMFLWHFKDGTTACSLQQEFIGDIGKNAGFLVTGKASHLEDIHRKQIQLLSLDNYPLKIELWIGKMEDSEGYSPELKGEELCFGAQSIESNHKYYFSACP